MVSPIRIALEILPRFGALLAFSEIIYIFSSEFISLSIFNGLIDAIMELDIVLILTISSTIGYAVAGILTIALGSPILFIATLLLKLLSLRGDISVLSNASIVIGLILIFVSSVIKIGYRSNQGISIRFRGSIIYTALSTAIFIFFIVSIAVYGSYFIARFITSYNIEASNIYLKPLLDFLFVNPIGRLIITGIFIMYFYTLLRNIGSTIILYTSPSRRVAASELSIIRDLDSSYSIPFRFILSLAFSAIISPPLYFIVRDLLSIVNIDSTAASNAIYSLTGLSIDPAIIDGGMALLLFSLFWLLYPRIFRSIVGKGLIAEGSGRSIIVLGVTVAIVYIASYYTGYIASDNPLELRGLDQHVSSIATSFYSYIYAFLELFPKLLGFAP